MVKNLFIRAALAFGCGDRQPHEGLRNFLNIFRPMYEIKKIADNADMDKETRSFLVTFAQVALYNKPNVLPPDEGGLRLAVQLREAVDKASPSTERREQLAEACYGALQEMRNEIAQDKRGFKTTDAFLHHGKAFGGGIGSLMVLTMVPETGPSLIPQAQELGLQVWATHVLGKASEDISRHGITAVPQDILPAVQHFILHERHRDAKSAEPYVSSTAFTLFTKMNPITTTNHAALVMAMPDRTSRGVVASCAAYANEGMDALMYGELPRPSKKRAIAIGLRTARR